MKISNSKNSTWYSFIHENARRYATLVPYSYEYFGKPISLCDSLLYDFTNCRKGQIMEYEPVNIACPDPPVLIQSSEIYHKHVGMIPNYFGHIPGAMFRIKGCNDQRILVRAEEKEGLSKDLNTKDIFFFQTISLLRRCGKTFGADTIDAKKWLQGDSAL